MARSTGEFNLQSNFEVQYEGPLDARIVTPLFSELTDGSIPLPYKGMLVSVSDNTADTTKNGVYLLTGADATLEASWTKFGAGSVTGLTGSTYIDVAGTTSFTISAKASTNSFDTSGAELVARDANNFAYAATASSGDNSTKLATTAFVNSYVGAAITLAGGFNADTGALDSPGTTNLETNPGTPLVVGNYYVVSVAGNFFNNANEPLTPGDYVIVQTARTGSESRTATDFIVVNQSSSPATSSTIGLSTLVQPAAPAVSGIGLAFGSGSDAGKITVTNTDKGSAQTFFKTINVNNNPGTGTQNVVASSNNDTLKLRGTGGTSITTDTSTKTITINTATGGGMSSWSLTGDATATQQQVTNGSVVSIKSLSADSSTPASNKISTASGFDSTGKFVTVSHDLTTRTDTTTPLTGQLLLNSGGTFTALTTATTDATGHLTAINTATYTLPQSVSGTGTPNKIVKFTGTGTGSVNTISDSSITDNGSTVTIPNVTIQGGSIDNTIIGANTAAAASFSSLSVSGGNSTFSGPFTASNGLTVSAGILNIQGGLQFDGLEGTSGQYLKSQGAATPVWDTLSLNDLSDASTPSTNNLLIGSGASMQGTENNQTVIGINAQGNGANTVTIGNQNVTDVKLGGAYTSLGASGTGIGKLFDRTNSFGTTGDLLSCDFDTGSAPGGIKWITPDYVSGKTAGSPNVAVTEIRTLTQTEYNALTSSNTVSITYTAGTTSYSLSPITQAAIGNGTLVVTKSGGVFATTNYNTSNGNLVLTSAGVGSLTNGDGLVATLSPTASIMYVIIGTSPSP